MTKFTGMVMGMGMGMKSWEWEGMGTEMLFPHTSNQQQRNCMHSVCFIQCNALIQCILLKPSSASEALKLRLYSAIQIIIFIIYLLLLLLLLLLQRVSNQRSTSYSKSVSPFVCPSVCLSHAGTVSKRLKLRSCGLH